MTTSGHRPRKSLRFAAWPEPDRLAWLAAARSGRDVFDDGGRAARWAASTSRAVRYAYARWLGFIAITEPDALALDPDIRASMPRLMRFLAHLTETVGSVSQHSMIRQLRDALVALAPGWDRTGLGPVVARLERSCSPRDKRSRVVITNRLLVLGHALMDAVPSGPTFQPEDLLGYRDGLMIALLAARPLRRRNFAAIEIVRHLIPVGEGFQIVFEGHETKTGQPIDVDVPADLVPRLAHYLANIRPHFPRAQVHHALWAGFKGRGLSGQAIYAAIAARTEAAFGHVVNPHLFRSCAATTIAIAEPGRIGLARDLLGHSSINTTNTYYNQARSIEASRLHADALSHCRARSTSFSSAEASFSDSGGGKPRRA